MRKFLTSAFAVLAVGPAAFAVVFTGVVPTDFNGASVVTVSDLLGDAAVPFNAPVGTVSGWDMTGASFDLDRAAGQLHVGLDFFGIAGDADGDGVDGSTSPWLAFNGGTDYPGLANSESICIAFDFDQNGAFDVIAGMGWDDGVYRMAQYNGPASQPYRRFGALLPAHQGPHFYNPLAGPDFELTLNSMDLLENLDPLETVCFRVMVFAGSLDDDGVGEDYILTDVCFTGEETVEAQLPTSLDLVRAFPNPFNPTTTLAVDVAQTGNVNLSVFNLNGQLVQTLVDGPLSAGSHQVQFSGAGLPSGLYLARLQTVSGSQVSRLILTK